MLKKLVLLISVSLFSISNTSSSCPFYPHVFISGIAGTALSTYILKKCIVDKTFYSDPKTQADVNKGNAIKNGYLNLRALLTAVFILKCSFPRNNVDASVGVPLAFLGGLLGIDG